MPQPLKPILQTVKFSVLGLTVRPELVPQGLPLVVEGWTVNPPMVRRPAEVPVGQALHERINRKLDRSEYITMKERVFIENGL